MNDDDLVLETADVKPCPHGFVYIDKCCICSRWISIKNEFPQNMQRVLAYCQDKDYDFFILAYYANEIFSEYLSECDRSNSLTLSKFITHWMPLPEPPK